MPRVLGMKIWGKLCCIAGLVHIEATKVAWPLAKRKAADCPTNVLVDGLQNRFLFTRVPFRPPKEYGTGVSSMLIQRASPGE